VSEPLLPSLAPVFPRKAKPMNFQAFLSYTREDAEDGYITTLRTFINYEINLLTVGQFRIWQDRSELLPGMRWWDEITHAIDTVSFLIPIITSRYLRSEVCRKEFKEFLNREKRLSRNDLIIPIVYVDTPELNDPDSAARLGHEVQLMVAEIRRRQYSSWIHLRLKPFDDPEVRQEMNRIAVRVNAVLETIAKRPDSGRGGNIDMKRQGILQLLNTLTERIDRTRFTREFRADLVHGILKSAKEEVEKLSNESAQYEQDLSLGENFIVRAGPVFAEAEQVYAVSIDVYPGFWIAPDQQRRAEEYTSRQPPNTKRLFVFSDLETALKYRNVLRAHYEQYGSSDGAVLLTSANRWREFLRQKVEPNQLNDIINKDFAILVYGDSSTEELYLATLSETTLRLQSMAKLQPFQESIKETFNSLASAGESAPEEHGILRWREAYGTSDNEWFNVLGRLFSVEERKPPVYHMVLFAATVDVMRLTKELENVVQPRLMSIADPTSNRPLIEDMWFGLRDAVLRGMAPSDGKFGGKLVIQNEIVENYPYCLVFKFRSTEDLRSYYEHPTHSDVRRQLLSTLDSTIASIYGTLDKLDESARREVSGAIEQAAARIMVRADYIRQGRSLLAVTPVPFSLPPKRRSGVVLSIR
jgi:hypothetical protein